MAALVAPVSAKESGTSTTETDFRRRAAAFKKLWRLSKHDAAWNRRFEEAVTWFASKFIPAGFKGGKTNELIDEVFLTFESGENATIVTTFTLVVDQIPEFFVPETPTSGRAPAPKPGQTGRFRPLAHFIPGTDHARRALIISGVHGSEPEGVRTVEKVLDGLIPSRSGATPEIGRWTPTFDTVIAGRSEPITVAKARRCNPRAEYELGYHVSPAELSPGGHGLMVEGSQFELERSTN